MKRQESPNEQSGYRSYVLRCWQVPSAQAGREERVWRFSLQEPRSNERRGFATLEALLVFLLADLADDRGD